MTGDDNESETYNWTFDWRLSWVDERVWDCLIGDNFDIDTFIEENHRKSSAASSQSCCMKETIFSYWLMSASIIKIFDFSLIKQKWQWYLDKELNIFSCEYWDSFLIENLKLLL